MEIMSLEEITTICLIKADRLTEAPRVLESCKEDVDGRRSYLLGVIYAKQQDYEKAAQEFQKIPVGSPYHAMANPFLEWFNATTSNPYASLKASNREEAAHIWEAALKENPYDFMIWHNLSVLYYWQAKHLEEEGQLAEAIPNWQKAIGYWAGILASDKFWREWATQRAKACGLQESDIPAIESGFMTYLETRASEKDQFESYISDVIKVRRGVEGQFHNYFKVKSKEPNHNTAEIYEPLLLDCSHELRVAHLLERAKKMHHIVEYTNQGEFPPNLEEWLSRALKHLKDDEIDIILNTIEQELSINCNVTIGVPSCGPMMLTFLNLTEEAQTFVNTVLQANATNATIAELRKPLVPTFAKLQFYLSPDLGRWLVMIDEEIFDKAINGIKEKLRRERPQGTLAWNLRLLLVMACYEKAKYMFRNQEYASAVEALDIANSFAYNDIINPFPFDVDIPRLIDDICRSIPQSVDQGKITLHEAQNLLQRLCAIAPLGRQEICRRALRSLPPD
jgi:tetratricopeptide (TPR) repeat protein